MSSSPPRYSKTKYILGSFLIHWILNVWYLFVRNKEIKVPAESQKFIDQGRGYIIAGFHEATLSLYRHATAYLQDRKGAKLVALVSQSKDGEIICQTFARNNLASIRGSSSRGGIAAFKSILKETRNGAVPIFTVDGPRGPRHVIKPGVIATASLTQFPILYLHSHYDRYIRFNSWDRHFFPKFGARLHVWYGEPFFVPKGLEEKGLEEYAILLQKKMKELASQMEEMIHSAYPDNSIDTA